MRGNGYVSTTSYLLCCKGCGIRYLQVDFLPHRMSGYCTEECLHREPRGVPTKESIGWKEGIAASSQRRWFPPLLPSVESPRKWAFDLVQYPRPIGWQIENWRLDDTFLSRQKEQT